MRYHETLVARFASKVVLDILPATAASLIGGVLFAHYGFGGVPEPVAQVQPASAEMMQLLRDEHGLIVSFLNAQVDREKTELAAASTLRRGSAEAVATSNVPAHAPLAATAKLAPPHTRVAAAMTSAATAAPVAPLVVAQGPQLEGSAMPSQVPSSLIAKTVGLKDHVVSVTHRVVSTLGVIPGWIGEHFGGTDTRPRQSADMVRAS